MERGENIIKLLREEGLEINTKLANTINMLAYESYEKAKEEGVEIGMKIGINRACSELRTKISTMEEEV